MKKSVSHSTHCLQRCKAGFCIQSVLSVLREGELGELTRASAVERKHGCYESLNLKIMSYFECLKMVSTKDERCVLA